MIRGPPAGPGRTPTIEPMPSVLTSRPAARNSRCRMARTGPSKPDGPAASESSRRSDPTRSDRASCAWQTEAVTRAVTVSALPARKQIMSSASNRDSNPGFLPLQDEIRLIGALHLRSNREFLDRLGQRFARDDSPPELLAPHVGRVLVL